MSVMPRRKAHSGAADAARGPNEAGKTIVQCEDTLVGRQQRYPVDMVILMGALEPQADAREVAKRFGISCSLDGWMIERHTKLDPVATMTEGVFVAGAAQGPKDIPTTVAQGAAAAARVRATSARRAPPSKSGATRFAARLPSQVQKSAGP